MTPEAARALYRRRIGAGETVLIRRYTGAGPNAPRIDAAVRARVTGFEPQELVGAIQQGDRKVIFLADDLNAAQFAQPVTERDKVVVRGKELAVKAADNSTRRVAGELIAYELTVQG
jgi:hypothetical protein